MTLKQIRLIDGQSQFDVFSNWQSALCRSLIRRGVDAQRMSVAEEAASPADSQVVSLGFNLVRNWAVPESTQRKHIVWGVDHPAFLKQLFLKQLGMRDAFAGESTAVCLVDYSRCDFAEKIYQYSKTYFLPHAGIAPLCDCGDWHERPYDAVFFGSISHPDKYRDQMISVFQAKLPTILPLIHQFFDSYSQGQHGPLDLVYWNLLQSTQMGDEFARVVFSETFMPMDLYFRSQKRIEFIRSVTGCPVHVFGSGPWDELGFPSNITVHSPVSHQEVAGVMAQSKVLLNHSPTHHSGSHERVFDGLLCGCRIVSSHSDFLAEEFPDGRAVVFYPIGSELQGDRYVQAALVGDPVESIRCAAAKVKKDHSMDARAAQLLYLIKERWGLLCAE